ncbi:hypothetical protein [Caudoviricetes sp.]|nr:hypothetical protein [Caudoviricetes sp.]
MCMGSVSAPVPQQTAPQVTPPAGSPDTASAPSTGNAQRRRAMASAGMNQNLSVNPLGLLTTAPTTKTASQQNLLG